MTKEHASEIERMFEEHQARLEKLFALTEIMILSLDKIHTELQIQISSCKPTEKDLPSIQV